MRHPYEKYVRIELLTLLIALFFTVLLIIYKKAIILLFSLCFLSLSLLSEAIFLLFTNKKAEAMKQALRSLLLLLLLITIIFAHLHVL